MIADAKRVLGYAGTFVPYKGFVDKILNARSFGEAMQLRPKKTDYERAVPISKSAALTVNVQWIITLNGTELEMFLVTKDIFVCYLSETQAYMII
ncbi:MAG: hypothetical protein QXP38_06665 [Nitrososphaerota archaeon]